METLGKRISALRKENGLTQEALAEKTGVTAQAVSKWENDQTCPDIQLLPIISSILGVSVDELLSGKTENAPKVMLLPEEQKRKISDMYLRIEIESSDGDRIRVNLPMALIQIAVETGLALPEVGGSSAIKNIDFKQIFELVSRGAIGNLVEIDSADGDKIRIFAE